MSKNYGSLFVVSTPIGNLDDITLRAIEVLNKVDICAAEDTRVSRKLLSRYDIDTKLTSYHKFSEKTKTTFLINELKSGKNIALISDAGTPLISDPGHYLLQAAIEIGITIIPIPGVTSVIAAASVSGFNLENLSFYGFFPRKEKEKKILLKKNIFLFIGLYFFESGRRINKLLDTLSEELPAETGIMIAREITKLHETFYRGDIKTVKDLISQSEFGSKGEFVIVIEGIHEARENDISEEDRRILEILMDKLDQKLAFELGSEILNKKEMIFIKLRLKTDLL